MSDTEDLTGTTWTDVNGHTRHVTRRVDWAARAGDWWIVTGEIVGEQTLSGPYIRNRWTHGPEKAVPAVAEPVKPSDVRDGDLLTGTLYGNPFTDWPVRVSDSGNVYTGDADGRAMGFTASGGWRGFISVSSRKPAQTPPLPWVEHPDAWWRHVDGSAVEHSDGFDSLDIPADWQRVAVIPWDLIERARRARNEGYTDEMLGAIQAILDAADEVAS